MLKVVAVLLLVCSVAAASQEQIHPPKAITLVAGTSLFGDVEVRGKVNTAGHVDSISVVVNKTTIQISAAWLKTLPSMTLAGIEIRTERGYGPKPVLYIVLGSDVATLPSGTKDQRVHLWIEDGKLTGASITTYDAKGSSKSEQRKGPNGTIPGATQKRSP